MSTDEKQLHLWKEQHMTLGHSQAVARSYRQLPYMRHVIGTANPVERVVFRQEPRTLQPGLRRSLLNVVSRHVVEQHLHVPFKTCEGCDDAVICEMHEQCLR